VEYNAKKSSVVWKKSSLVWNTMRNNLLWLRNYLPLCGIQSGIIFHGVGNNVELSSVVWDISRNNLPWSGIQCGVIFCGVGYNLE